MLTIIRGLPGSGKSTLAHRISAETHACVIEPDALLYQNGVYCYSAKDFHRAVHACMSLINVIQLWCPWVNVIYSDVLPTRADVLDFNEGLMHSADKVIDMPPLTLEEARAKNIHDVCEYDLKQMVARWEPWDGCHNQKPE